MLDDKGNTGVYLIYSYVRICSILRKANYDSEESLEKLINEHKFTVSNKPERDLVLNVLRLPEQIEQCASDL
jgi:arginyl-tRNA synthetase